MLTIITCGRRRIPGRDRTRASAAPRCGAPCRGRLPGETSRAPAWPPRGPARPRDDGARAGARRVGGAAAPVGVLEPRPGPHPAHGPGPWGSRGGPPGKPSGCCLVTGAGAGAEAAVERLSGRWSARPTGSPAPRWTSRCRGRASRSARGSNSPACTTTFPLCREGGTRLLPATPLQAGGGGGAPAARASRGGPRLRPRGPASCARRRGPGIRPPALAIGGTPPRFIAMAQGPPPLQVVSGVFPEGDKQGARGARGGRDLGKSQVPGLKRLPRHP